MIVVADTTPLNYLILIGAIDVLPRLYRRVVIPPAVHVELIRDATPVAVRSWVEGEHPWLEIVAPGAAVDPALAGLDEGEREAIALAEQLSADQLIIDERLGRRMAELRGLSVIGTIGVLREAADGGLIDLRKAVDRLQKTSFHISPDILARLLEDR